LIDSGGLQIIQQMKALGLFDGAKFMGPDGLYSGAGGAGPAAVNTNVYVTFAACARSTPPTWASALLDYKAKYKDEPIGWAMCYQATMVTVDAINAGPKIAPRSWKRYATKNFEGIPVVSASTTMATRTAPTWVGFRSKIISSSSPGD
jgi:hypothetical protein